MKYFTVTIKALIDEDLYQQQIDKGYTPDMIMRDFKRECYHTTPPVPAYDIEVTDIQLEEE